MEKPWNLWPSRWAQWKKVKLQKNLDDVFFFDVLGNFFPVPKIALYNYYLANTLQTHSGGGAYCWGLSKRGGDDDHDHDHHDHHCHCIRGQENIGKLPEIRWFLSTFSRLAEEVSNALDSDGAEELLELCHFLVVETVEFMCELCWESLDLQFWSCFFDWKLDSMPRSSCGLALRMIRKSLIAWCHGSVG